ncbi:tumor necrosis factor receptor superfamily member 5 isoform X1 [Epinephelus lanceolatus]|uniref:tumor necrosis factor receptor superfamily member 5 n=1 Tax=Epinephelus lanceolatus TaxID=310571 RepID=UPI00144728C9|nr:tumor necrosis factor receptor superfamily member 5 [Epinephelus lanceolatus]
MANLNCSKDEYPNEADGLCCDRCAAGQYMKERCGSTRPRTVCAKCGNGGYTDTENYLSKCHQCKTCSHKNNQRNLTECTDKANAVCECVDGFYCSDDECDHCLLLTSCPKGKGVEVQATRTKDVICAPCPDGTFSNVSDSSSPCRPHTRCEDYGRVLKTPGTRDTDAICGEIKCNCPWILPAGLWSGLVLTALILLGLICWRAKRKSYRAARSSVPVSLDHMVPAPFTQLELPLPFTDLSSHCQESCPEDGCKLRLFNSDDHVVSCVTQDSVGSVDSNHPITPLNVSVSFIESSHTNGSAGYCTNFHRTHSEPQEDEWVP